MKRIIITALLAIPGISGMAQNNPIFSGGDGDGWSGKSYQQAANNIYKGGSGDGLAAANYQQPENNIFNGGSGDGWTKYSAIYQLKISDFENNVESNLSVYPNPTTRSIQIELDRFYDSLIAEIFTLDGRNVQHKEFNNVNSIKLDIDTQAGIYFIKLFYNNKTVSVKVIKQ